MASAAAADGKSLIFTYDTLKCGHANHNLIRDLLDSNDSVFLGSRFTTNTFPLVIGLYGIPYLINLPGEGNQVKGELYAVSDPGIARLDELEGVAIGHYERLPIQLLEEGKDGVVVEAEAYFAHGDYAEKMWEKKGKVGISEFGEIEGKEYVPRKNRPPRNSFMDGLKLFVNCSV